MAATMADLFGDSEDEDEEFMPAKRSAPQEDLDRSEGQGASWALSLGCSCDSVELTLP